MLDRSTIWPYDEKGEPGRFFYSRYGHPVGVEAEQALGELDGGHALLFPSGSGAITALVLGLLEPGQTIALAEGGYYGTALLFRAVERWGVRFVEFDQTGPPPSDADLIWLEAPSNPFLTMPDLEAAVASPARVVVDSTAATPVYLRPLEQGADFVVHSATSSAPPPTTPTGCTNSGDARESSPRRIPAGSCFVASRPSACAWNGSPQPLRS